MDQSKEEAMFLTALALVKDQSLNSVTFYGNTQTVKIFSLQQSKMVREIVIKIQKKKAKE